MPPTLSDAAYAHAVAVLGEGETAVEAAVIGLKLGGRSRSMVLGHTRAAAIEQAVGGFAPDLDQVEPADLAELARLLAFTRPAEERAIVDLDTRHGLDRAALGRALGLPPAIAAMRAAEVMLAWQSDLDPVVLARLGAGGCVELGDLLALATVPSSAPVDDSPPALAADVVPQGTLGERLAQGAIVSTHAETCAACRDRLVAMVSVRTLLAQTRFDTAPPLVRAAATRSRHRASIAPPPIEPLAGAGAGAPSQRPFWPMALGAVAIALVIALIGSVIASSRSHPGSGRVDALTKVPAAGTTLEVTPSLLETASPPAVVLRNLSREPVEWKATSDVPWLTSAPAAGKLDAGAFDTITLAISPTSPEGELRAAVTFTATDGSTAIARLHTIVGHPPDVATMLTGCVVRAAVVDDSQIGSVLLHWHETAGSRTTERSAVMGKGDAGYTATLPPTATGQTWWVVATDALGNTARTAEQPAPACP
jgi:hypothetical protein